MKFDAKQRAAPPGLDDLDVAACDRGFLEAIREALESRKVPVYVFGPPGRGKSYGMAAAFVSWVLQGADWNDVSQLLRKVMRCRMSEGGFIYESRGEASVQVFESGIMDRIGRATLCCFDDVGLRSPSEAMYDAWYEIVNLRKRKPTIFTGNLSPKDLHKSYDARIASRLTEGTVIELAGKDRRLSQTKFVKLGA